MLDNEPLNFTEINLLKFHIKNAVNTTLNLCLNNAIFKHTECIKHQKYLAQMGSNTKTISKLGKVCGTFMKVSFFILTSVKTNIC